LGGNTKDDPYIIQGKWRVVSIVHLGGIQKKRSEPSFWEISKEQITYEGKQIDFFRLDPMKSPKEIDVTIKREGRDGFTLKGIYSLQGDELKICLELTKDERPEAFESPPNSGRRLIVLRRVKK
jgi:uncharacterized protein (TIGR03067 family)